MGGTKSGPSFGLNGFRIDLRGSGGASYIQVGPRGSDFRGPGALKPKFTAQEATNLFLYIYIYINIIIMKRPAILLNLLQLVSLYIGRFGKL